MPPELETQFREKSLSQLLWAIKSIERKKALGALGLSVILKVLRGALRRLNRLATLAGLSLFAYVAAEATHQTSSQAAEPVRMQSSIAMDFDGDGDLDLIDADSATGKIHVLRNDGLRFEREEVHAADFSADLVANVDMDGDGDEDIVLIDKDAGGIAWLENKGSEVFVPHNVANLQGPVNEAFVADMNQDGKPDVVYTTPGAVGWVKNQGSDGFVPQAPYVSGLTDVSALEVADSDGDGDNDVYYADSSFAGVGWVKNNGSENFVPQVVGSQVGWWTPIDSLEMTDLDEDGHKDLIYSSKSLSAVGWMANNGSENFIPSQLAGELTAVDQVQVADLDQDGDLDLVASSSEANTHAWLENNGSEGFIPHDIG